VRRKASFFHLDGWYVISHVRPLNFPRFPRGKPLVCMLPLRGASPLHLESERVGSTDLARTTNRRRNFLLQPPILGYRWTAPRRLGDGGKIGPFSIPTGLLKHWL